MTLARFDPQDKTIKEFLDHCKELEGLEMEFGTLAPVGVADDRPLREDRRKRKKKDKERRDREDDREDRESKKRRTEDYESRKKYKYRKRYSESRDPYKKKTRFDARKAVPDQDKKTFSQQEMNVIISHEMSKAVA